MDTQLLIALALLVGLAGAGFWAYSLWQDRERRKALEREFGAPGHTKDKASAATSLTPKPDTRAGVSPSPPAGEEPAAPPALPPQVHMAIDLVLTLQANSAVPISALRDALIAEYHDAAHLPMRWYFLEETTNHWNLIDIDAMGEAYRLVAALQLCNRQGSIGEPDYLRFTGGVERVADRLQLSVGKIDSRVQVLRRAAQLDRLCQEVDVQIALNLVPRDGKAFPGTKVRAAAEAFGFRLDADGVYRCLDEAGNVLFALIDAEGTPFFAPEMKSRQVAGLTLVLEPVHVSSSAVFERMAAIGDKFRKTLDAELTDDAGNAITAESLKWIRQQIDKLHQKMKEAQLPPGSRLAKRLFS